MAKPEPEYDVTVISRDEVTTYPKIATPVVNMLVTYVSMGLPPHTVTIAKEKYTLEWEKKVIKKDIQERLKARPESYKV